MTSPAVPQVQGRSRSIFAHRKRNTVHVAGQQFSEDDCKKAVSDLSRRIARYRHFCCFIGNPTKDTTQLRTNLTNTRWKCVQLCKSMWNNIVAADVSVLLTGNCLSHIQSLILSMDLLSGELRKSRGLIMAFPTQGVKDGYSSDQEMYGSASSTINESTWGHQSINEELLQIDKDTNEVLDIAYDLQRRFPKQNTPSQAAAEEDGEEEEEARHAGNQHGGGLKLLNAICSICLCKKQYL